MPARAQEPAREIPQMIPKEVPRVGAPEAAAGRSLIVPLFINGRFQRELRALIPAAGEALRFEGQAFLAIAERGLKEALMADLAFRQDKGGYLSLDDLKALGMTAEFDVAQLRLVVEVPVDLMRPQLIELQRRTPTTTADPLRQPDAFSAYVNARGAVEYIHEIQSATTGPGSQPVLVNFDGAFNPGSFVLEWAATYDQDRDNRWQRDDVSVVFDQPENAWRTRLGDLSYPTTGFQSFVAAGGITFAKNFDLQPYRVTQPTVRGSFFLKQESKVEVLVNNVVVRTLRLQPGPYDIRDFPLQSGINDAKLRITDPTGQVQIINYPTVVDSTMLAPGEHEFSYSVGFPSATRNGFRRYDGALGALSLFHRYGVGDTLTLGANFQGNHLQQMAGVEGVWAVPLGVFDADLGFSRVDGHAEAMAARLGFRRDDHTQASGWQRVWSLSAEFRSPDFATLGTLAPDNGIAWDFTARVSQHFPGDISVGLGGTYQIGREERRDTDSQNIVVTKAWDSGVSASLHLERQRHSGGDAEGTVFVSLNIPLADNRQRLTATHDSDGRTSRLQWERNSPVAAGGVDAEVAVERAIDTYDLSGELTYTGQRGRATLTHDVTSPRTDGNGDLRDRRSSMRLETSLVYAGGRFGIGRPVSEAFALLAPHPTLQGQEIGINPMEDTHTASIDAWGNAVWPELGAYRQAVAEIDAPEVPQGLEIGPHRYQLLPGYKSGILIEVGTGATVFVLGDVADADGSPVTLAAAEIVSRDKPQAEPILTFTNRAGRFAAEGLRPGKYLLRLYATPDRPIAFEVPEGTVGRFDMGRLTRPAAPDGAPPEKGG